MKFRKKPVVIEAVQLKAENWDELCNMIPDLNRHFLGWWETKYHGRPLELEIPTLEGLMKANENDWIIRGVDGEFYPIKNDIFLKTYEEVSDEQM